MTWNDIIDLAFLDLGVTQPGETISAAMRADAQTRLNALLSSLNTEGATVYTQGWFGGNLVAGQTAYTLGAGGGATFPTSSRVQKITAWRATFDGILAGSGPVLSFEQFPAQTEGGEQRAIPRFVAADTAYPNINIRVAPPPSNIAAAIEFHGWTPIAQIADFTIAANLPEGWSDMLHFNLAVHLAPQYARANGISQELAANAQNTKAALVAQNQMGAQPAPQQ